MTYPASQLEGQHRQEPSERPGCSHFCRNDWLNGHYERPNDVFERRSLNGWNHHRCRHPGIEPDVGHGRQLGLIDADESRVIGAVGFRISEAIRHGQSGLLGRRSARIAAPRSLGSANSLVTGNSTGKNVPTAGGPRRGKRETHKRYCESCASTARCVSIGTGKFCARTGNGRAPSREARCERVVGVRLDVRFWVDPRAAELRASLTARTPIGRSVDPPARSGTTVAIAAATSVTTVATPSPQPRAPVSSPAPNIAPYLARRTLADGSSPRQERPN